MVELGAGTLQSGTFGSVDTGFEDYMEKQLRQQAYYQDWSKHQVEGRHCYLTSSNANGSVWGCCYAVQDRSIDGHWLTASA
jgi:hypothetical protein